MQKIRLGHFSSCVCVCVCVCVSAMATDTSLQCFLDLNVFYLSYLRSALAGELWFLMSQMSNVNGIEQHAQL